jgi:AraC family transcriptional regulator
MVRRRINVTGGRRLRSVRVGGFTLSEGVHRDGAELPWHHHETPTICFVLNGAFTESWRGGSLTCTPSTLKLTPAGERHRDQFDRGDVRGLLIEVDRPQVAAMQPYADVLDERISFHGGLVSSIAWRLCDEVRRTDAAAPLATEGLLLELLAAATRRNSQTARMPGWLGEVRERINDDLAARHSLAALAQAVGVHPVTLARAFRRAYGCTVGEYVRRMRIERATNQLAHSDATLAEIALTAGFADQSHFSNLFRRHTGLSPSRFRQAVRAS